MTKILNLNHLVAADEKPKTMPFELLEGADGKPRKWTMLTAFNALAIGRMQEGGDDALAAFHQMFRNLVIPEERDEWQRALVEANIPAEKLMEIMGELIAAAGKDDSTSAAPSSATPVKRASVRRSTAS